VNLLLVEPAELREDRCVLTDRRAVHLREVLGVTPGSVIKMGVLGGPIGTGEVLTDDPSGIALHFTSIGSPAPQMAIELVLAMPRPKVLARVIEACAAFAIRRIDLTNAWRVDKSYLKSPKLAPAALALDARLGAEQGATTHLPEIVLDRSTDLENRIGGVRSAGSADDARADDYGVCVRSTLVVAMPTGAELCWCTHSQRCGSTRR